jgi:hypothetical protein
MRFMPENQAFGSLLDVWFSGGFSAFRRRARKAHAMIIQHLASKGFRIADRLAYANAGGQTQVPGSK